MKRSIVAVAGLVVVASGALLYGVHSRAGGPEDAPAAPLLKASDLVSAARGLPLDLRSSAALVLDAGEGVPLYARDIDAPRPIASLTKLMTAMVILDSGLPLDEPIAIADADRDRRFGTGSRLLIDDVYSREDLLRAALAASDNRAAAALARTYPGDTPTFVATMNAKAAALGMTNTFFRDSSGLDRHNVSTARDLARLAQAAMQYPLIVAYTTTEELQLTERKTGLPLEMHNTNRLLNHAEWEIGLSKTGYTSAAGHCLIMEARIADRPVILVLLNSWGKLSRYGDSNRIRDWLLRIEQRLRAQDRTQVAARQS